MTYKITEMDCIFVTSEYSDVLLLPKVTKSGKPPNGWGSDARLGGGGWYTKGVGQSFDLLDSLQGVVKVKVVGSPSGRIVTGHKS